MEKKLNWLAFESGILTPRFQKLLLVVNYSILALACVFYLVGLVGTWGIVLGCAPGVAWFAISLEALAWKMANSNEDFPDFDMFSLMGFIR